MDYTEIFEYRDGELYWKIKPYKSRVQIGDKAGGKASKGYKAVKYQSQWMLQHRVIWEMHNGPIPKGMCIDHIDRDRANNKLENLRCVSYGDNLKNSECYENAAGFSERQWGFEARIRKDGKLHHLGTFKNQNEAREAYLEARNNG